MVERILRQVGRHLSLLRAGQAGRLLGLRSEGRDPGCGLLTAGAGGEERGPGLGTGGGGWRRSWDTAGLSLLVTAGVSH